MNSDVTEAVMRLQLRLQSATAIPRSDILEDALNFLLSRPTLTGTPEVLIDRAMAYAHKKHGRRRRLFREYADGQLAGAETCDAVGALGVEAMQAAETLSLRDQTVLRLAWTNDGHEGVAAGLAVSPQQASKLLHRSRARFFAVWASAA